MIIDAHCHAGRGDGLSAPWNSTASLTAYLRRAESAGIDHTIVVPAFHSDYAVANRELAAIVARSRGRLTGFAMVHAGRDAGRIEEMLTEATARHGFRGVKVHGGDHLPTRELCEVAARLELPMLLDVSGKAHVVDLLAREYPRLDFIIAHLGSFADDWRAHERLVEQLARYPNVYADTSGVRRFDYVVRAIQNAGAQKLLFGSDGPWLHPGLELHKIRLLGLTRTEEARVLGGNMRALLAKRRAPHAAELDPPRPLRPARRPS
jgi:uncharacterized protein